MKYKFIVQPSPNCGTTEWYWYGVATNGKKVGWSGETYKRRSYAIKTAKAMAAGRPVFVKVGEKLIPA